jgi:transcriptional regulator NrdR family protein
LASSATILFEQVFGRGGTGKGSGTWFASSSPNGIYNQANTTTWNTISDRRIKKNIVDNNVGLNKIAQIQVRDFEYRDFDEVTDFENPKAVHVDKPGVQIGVIAQEIEDIFPEMIITQSTGVKTFNSEKLVFYLINAVKELKTRIEVLENE